MLDTATATISLSDNYQAHRLDMPFPVPSDIGQWLLSHQLFAEGNDFTSGWAENPKYVGNSFLRQMWLGNEGRCTQGATQLSAWIITQDLKPVGIVAWLRTDTPEGIPRTWIDDVPTNASHYPKQRIPAAILGHLMCYQKADHRGKGLIKQILTGITPELETLAEQSKSQGNMPLVVANDATHKIMDQLTDIPLVEEMDLCRKLRADVWQLWTKVHMYPEWNDARGSYLVDPQPWPRPAPKRKMR